MVGRAALVDDGVGAVLGMGHGGESLLLTLLAHHALAHEVLARHTGVVIQIQCAPNPDATIGFHRKMS